MAHLDKLYQSVVGIVVSVIQLIPPVIQLTSASNIIGNKVFFFRVSFGGVEN